MRSPQHLPIGLHLDQYTIDTVLGSGGFGVTYRATDTRRGRMVALKEYFPKLWAVREENGSVRVANSRYEQEFRSGLDRFIAEAETLARFQHECIVRVERVFGAMGSGLIQLEYIPGPNLERWLLAKHELPSQAEFDAFATGLLGALSAIHRGGILHRDISPRNILLSERGLPIVIDFGSSRQVARSFGQSPNIFITPHYAPQEQYVASGAQQGPWTDIYSAAATLYRIVKGSPPPAAPQRAVDPAKIVLRGGSLGLRYRPESLAAIEWGLEFHPLNRPQSVDEWRSQLISSDPTETSSGLRVLADNYD